MAGNATTSPTSTLSALSDERARRDPDAPCIDDDRRALTSGEFAARVRAVADDLHSRGVGRGDLVAAMLPNRAEFVVTTFAAWRVGAAFIPINPSLTPAEAGYQIVDSGARILVDDRTPIEVGGVARLDVDLLSTVPPRAEQPPLVEPSDLALLV